MCDCVVNHVPSRYKNVIHHIIPRSWGGPDTAVNKIAICPTTHENVHDLLNECVRRASWPDWAYLQQFNVFTRKLALQAWNQRPSDTPPRTATA